MSASREPSSSSGVSASGTGAAAVGEGSSGIVSTGHGARNTQIQLGTPRPIGEVPPAAGPVGLPGVGVFDGRGDELAALDAALQAEGAVVVQAVSGLGGIGKSTLAARYALERAGAYSQVVWAAADSASALDAGL